MSTIKFSKYSSIILFIICLAVIGYQEIKVSLPHNSSGQLETTTFKHTFEIEKEIQGINTDLGFFNLKKSDKYNVDLIALNEKLTKGDLIEIEISQKAKDNAYPNLISIKKGEEFIWKVEDAKLTNGGEQKPNNREWLFLMIICVIGFFIAQLSEQRLKSNKHQILTIPKAKFTNDIYLKHIHQFSFSICNNDFIVFSNQDRINRSELIIHNRMDDTITVNGLATSRKINVSSIKYLIFQFDLINAKQTYYETEFYFQTQHDELIHIITITSNEIRHSKHHKTDFYKDMLNFSILICQELDLKLKNTSSIKIQTLTLNKQNCAATCVIWPKSFIFTLQRSDR